MPNDLLEAALQYAGRNWYVFPCKPKGKTPLTRHGFKDATNNPAEIERLWAKWPNANIGIATGRISGLLVIDVDSPEALAALKNIALIFGGKNGLLPYTLVSSTGRGWHIWYDLTPNGDPIPCSKGEGPEKGLDVRADGGYCIAPPSIHPNGNQYKWLTQG